MNRITWTLPVMIPSANGGHMRNGIHQRAGTLRRQQAAADAATQIAIQP